MAAAAVDRQTPHILSPPAPEQNVPTTSGTLQSLSSGPAYSFSFNPFLRKEYRFGISPSRPYCKAFREGHCPLGPACPDKHPVTHSTNNLVCKHWLKGLCKKGDSCDFVHEYNIRARSECTHFARGYCPSGDDCNYLHLDPNSPHRRPTCQHYERGFCPLGPRCSKRHVRKVLCRFYLAGFCPNGKGCKEGEHPRFPTDLPKPTVLSERALEEAELERQRYREEAERREEMEWERSAAAGGGMGERGGRGRGRGRFNARRRGAY